MSNKKSPDKLQNVDVSSTPALRNRSSAESSGATNLWLDEFTERMTHPGPEEEEFFERRRQLKLGAGIDENGNLVTSNSKPKE
ncbi:hypothetical protein FIV00_15555 [Labrenzia sp. THAF82]|uniref:hypothetical protein n=1 Tax=Labrenzia sp. THAF82 TaxID=2587861 RepID=UPI00126790C3|nr:hypothetical protein [Labrenzia sp. THAF82]QFT31909.1 hypothetical protein FIV00_15555 [Labrenzia sp. THAF82]